MAKGSDIELKLRRLDSFARLIQGDDKCGAVCFDNTEILIATNKDISKSEIARTTIQYLTSIASKAKEFNEKIQQILIDQKNPEQAIKESIDNFLKDIVLLNTKNRKLIINSNEYSKIKGFKDEVDIAIIKLTISVISSYIEQESDKALDLEFIEALRNNKIRYITGSPARNKKDIHAEMKIMQELFERKKITKGNTQQFYIGISKRCCKKCEALIKAVNEVMGHQIEEIIEVRDDGHLNGYPCGIPLFIDYEDDTLNDKERKDIRIQFLKNMDIEENNEVSLTKVFEKKSKGERQLHHDRSPSPKGQDKINFVIALKELLQNFEKKIIASIENPALENLAGEVKKSAIGLSQVVDNTASIKQTNLPSLEVTPPPKRRKTSNQDQGNDITN